MKWLIALLAVLTLGLTVAEDSLPKREASWRPGPDETWEIHYYEALKKAIAEKKLIFVLSTGSDWCPWCVRLHDGVLARPGFRELAAKYLILLYLDYPQQKKLPPSQARHNAAVRRLLKLDYSGYPAAVIIDSAGTRLGFQSGFAPEKEYLQFIRRTLVKAEVKLEP